MVKYMQIDGRSAATGEGTPHISEVTVCAVVGVRTYQASILMSKCGCYQIPPSTLMDVHRRYIGVGCWKLCIS